MKFYTYIHRTADDGRIFYVGKGSGRRAWNFTQRTQKWKDISLAHGVNVEICAYWQHEEDCLSHERLLISCMNDLKISLCNLSIGGTTGPTGYKYTEAQRLACSLRALGRKHSEEARRKMSLAQKGRIGNVWTDEQRVAASLARKGKPGRIKSPEEIAKLSANNGSYRQEVKDKIAKSLIGRKASLESRIKRSLASKGVPKTEEHKAKIRAARLAFFQKNREQFGCAQTISESHKAALRNGYNKRFGKNNEDN
jgi:hypothetical protein